MTWKPDPTIENLLSPGTTASLDQWRAVKDYLLRSFAAFLGQEIDTVWEPLYEDISPGWGFAFGIRSQAALGGPYRWSGTASFRTTATTQPRLFFFSRITSELYITRTTSTWNSSFSQERIIDSGLVVGGLRAKCTSGTDI